MGTQPRTISKADALAEAYKRGLLPPDKKAAYEEAQRRGLVGGQPAAVAQPAAPQAAPLAQGAAPASRTPMGGASGEFDLSKFEALPKVQQQATLTPNLIDSAWRQGVAQVNDNFAEQQRGAPPRRTNTAEIGALADAAAYNFQGAPTQEFDETGTMVSQGDVNRMLPARFGAAAANAAGPGMANAILEAGDAMFGSGPQVDYFGNPLPFDEPKPIPRITFGDDNLRDTRTPLARMLPLVPMDEARGAVEGAADMTGTLAGYIAGPGKVVDAGARGAVGLARGVPGAAKAAAAITPQGASMLAKGTRYGGRIGATLPRDIAHAAAFGAVVGEDGKRLQTAGQFAADPINWAAIPAASLIYRASIALKTMGGRVTPEAVQLQQAMQTLQRGDAAPAQIQAAAQTIDEMTPPAPDAGPAPSQADPSAPPPGAAQASPQPIPPGVQTATRAAPGAPPPPVVPPSVAQQVPAVPPGAAAAQAPPPGTLTPIPQEAVEAFNAMPRKTREAMLRTLQSTGSDAQANTVMSRIWRGLTGQFGNSQEAMAQLRSLNNLPPDQQTMYALELMQRYGGDVETALPAMGRGWAVGGARKDQLFGGRDRAREIMDQNIRPMIDGQGPRITEIAEGNFGPGVVPAQEALDQEFAFLSGEYDKLLNPQRKRYGRLRNEAKLASIDTAYKEIQTYLKRPDVIDEMPDWVKRKVMDAASKDMRALNFSDQELATILAGDGAVLAPLFQAAGPMQWSPALWKHLVDQYPTQAAHILQSAYRQAADGLLANPSRSAADVTDARYLLRLRGESGNGGLVDMLERAIPGKGGRVDGEGGYNWLRNNFGDASSAEEALSLLKQFKSSVNDEAKLGEIMTSLKKLPPRQLNNAEQQITSIIRQEIGRKIDSPKLSELGNSDRLPTPNLTALSSQNFLNALEDVFGPRGKELADGIRLARAQTDALTSIHPRYNARTALNNEDVANAPKRYEDPAGVEGNVFDKTFGALASSGLATGAAGALGIGGAASLTVPLLGLAAGKAAYNAYKAGKRLTNTERNQLIDYLFRVRKPGEAAPRPPGNRLGAGGFVAGRALRDAAIGATAGAAASGGDPNAALAGAVGGAGIGAVRGISRLRSSQIKPPGQRGPRRRGPPPAAAAVQTPAQPRQLPGQTSPAAYTATGAATGAVAGAMLNPDDPGRGAFYGAIGGAGVGAGVGRLSKMGGSKPKTVKPAPGGRVDAPSNVQRGPWKDTPKPPKPVSERQKAKARLDELRAIGLSGKQARAVDEMSLDSIKSRGQATPDFQRGVEVATLRGQGIADEQIVSQLGIRGGKEELDRLEELVGAYDWGHPAMRPEFYANSPEQMSPMEIMEFRQLQAKRQTVTPFRKPPPGAGGKPPPVGAKAALDPDLPPPPKPAAVTPTEAADGKLRAYHGSPNDFDNFALTDETIGTGEGAQSYGHGLYFAENPKVGKVYRSGLSGVDTYVDGQPFDNANPYHLATQELRSRPWGNADDAIGALRYQRKSASGPERKTIDAAIRLLKNGDELGKRSTAPRGYLYEVDIAADRGQLLDLDAPIANQSESVKAGLAKLEERFGVPMRPDEAPLDYFYRIEAKHGERAPQRISETLKDAGVPGSMFFDKGSRASGDGTRNFVIFDDSRVSLRNKEGPSAPPSKGPGGKPPTGTKLSAFPGGTAAQAASGAGGAAYGYANPVDANEDGVIDDQDRAITATTLGLGGLTAAGLARNALSRGPRGVKSAPASNAFGGGKGPPKPPPARKPAGGNRLRIAPGVEVLPRDPNAPPPPKRNKGAYEMPTSKDFQEEALRKELRAARAENTRDRSRYAMRDNREELWAASEAREQRATEALADYLAEKAAKTQRGAGRRDRYYNAKDFVNTERGGVAIAAGLGAAGLAGTGAMLALSSMGGDEKKPKGPPVMSPSDPRFYWERVVTKNKTIMQDVQWALGEWGHWDKEVPRTGANGTNTKEGIRAWRESENLDPDKPMTRQELTRLLAGPGGYEGDGGKWGKKGTWYTSEGKAVRVPQ